MTTLLRTLVERHAPEHVKKGLAELALVRMKRLGLESQEKELTRMIAFAPRPHTVETVAHVAR